MSSTSSSSTLVPNTIRLAHELRLFGIHGGVERRAAEALATSLHPLEYLLLVLEDERLYRQEMTAKRLGTRAKFRSGSTLEEWDHHHERGLTKPQFREVASLSFHTNRENLLLVGPTGTGKTHLAIALGKKLCTEGIGVQFFSVNLLFEECLAEKAAGRYLGLVNRMKKIPVLILDDFGLRMYTHDEANVLMDVLEERYQKGVVIITSQVDPKGWTKLFEDPVIADAITDRLTKPGRLVRLEGPSYREKLKKKTV
jgi:DNA replication protein DnaC